VNRSKQEVLTGDNLLQGRLALC